MAWDFVRTEERKFEELPEGDYLVAIESAEMAVSKKGNDMLVIKMAVSGSKNKLWNYIVFMDDKPEITNSMLTQFFDSFGIEDGDFNIGMYTGLIGACRVKHDDEGRAKVAYFIHKNRQDKLGEWIGDKIERPQFTEVELDDDLPF